MCLNTKCTIAVLDAWLGIRSFALWLFALLLKIAQIIEQLWVIRSHHSLKKCTHEQLLSISLKKSNVNDSLMIQANRSQNKSDSLKKSVFFVCFWQFSPFLSRERITPVALSSVALNKRATVSKSLLLLLTKERWEWFALFHEQIDISTFAHKKIHSKNRWANSQT